MLLNGINKYIKVRITIKVNESMKMNVFFISISAPGTDPDIKYLLQQ